MIRRRAVRAFTLVEVALALIVLLMMILVFAATMPLALRAAAFSNNYNQAAFLAQHKIDQLRALGWNNIVNTSLLTGSGTPDVTNYATLSATDPAILDTGQTKAPYTFTKVDGLTSFFPQGSTGALTITPDPNAAYCSSTLTPLCDVVNVTITITWSGGGLSNGAYTTTAKIIQMNHE